MNEQIGTALSEEHCRHIEDVLARSGIRDPIKTKLLKEEVTKAVHSYTTASTRQTTPRQIHDSLTDLWQLANEKDPQIEVIRIRIRKLSESAISNIGGRARNLWPRLFQKPFPGGDFVEWSRTAVAGDLLKVLLHCIDTGGSKIKGRKRPGGKRSAPSLAPIIQGVARGGGSVLEEGHSNPTKGGRPSADLEDELVVQLAFAWAEVTGLVPSFVRTDKNGLSALVHHVFSWLDLEGADQALRRMHDNTRPLEAFQPGEWVS